MSGRSSWAMITAALLPMAAAGVAMPIDPPPRLDLRIASEGWGGAPLDNVEAVLRSTGDELTRHYGGQAIPPLRVEPRGGPIVLFQRDDNGAVVVKLDTGDTYWSQYAYQFAHEFGHVLCRYDADIHGNDWFEEALCETASLYALRRLGERWKTDAPYDNWREFAPAMTRYADELLAKATLPEEQTLAAWYVEHAEALRRRADRRELNRVPAAVMLAMFEADPQRWEAVRWINEGKPNRVQTLGEFLGDWRRHAPPRHRAFIESIGETFGVAMSE